MADIKEPQDYTLNRTGQQVDELLNKIDGIEDISTDEIESITNK